MQVRSIEDPRIYRQKGPDRPPSADDFDRRVDRISGHPRSVDRSFKDQRPFDDFSPTSRIDRPAQGRDLDPSLSSYASIDESYRRGSSVVPSFTSSLVERELAAMKQKIADLERLRALELSVYGAGPHSVPSQRNASPPPSMPSSGYRDSQDRSRLNATREHTFRSNPEIGNTRNYRGPGENRVGGPAQATWDSRDLRDGRDVRAPPPQMVPSHGVPSHDARYNNYNDNGGPRNTLTNNANATTQLPRHASSILPHGRPEAPPAFNSPKTMLSLASRIDDSRAPLRGREQIFEESRLSERDLRTFRERSPLRPSQDAPQRGTALPYRNVAPNLPWDRRNPVDPRDGPNRSVNANPSFQPSYHAPNGRR